MVRGRGYKRSSGKGSLIVMFAALTLLTVYLANVLPALRITFYFISSVFIMGTMMERKTAGAVISFIAVLLIGFLIVPVKLGMLPYLFLRALWYLQILCGWQPPEGGRARYEAGLLQYMRGAHVFLHRRMADRAFPDTNTVVGAFDRGRVYFPAL